MKLIYRGREWELEGGRRTAREAILRVGLDPEAVLVVRKGELLTQDRLLEKEDVVELIGVISGGLCSKLREG